MANSDPLLWYLVQASALYIVQNHVEEWKGVGIQEIWLYILPPSLPLLADVLSLIEQAASECQL